MADFEMDLQKEWYDYIFVSEKKPVEGRFNKGKFKEMKVGDTIDVSSKGLETKRVVIKEKKEFDSFLEMIQYFGRDKVIPDRVSDEEAVKVYKDIYEKIYVGKSLDQLEKEFGVVGIVIEKIDN